jgi:hypothetical protein
MEKIGTAFRRSVTAFAEAEDAPVVRFDKDDRKIDVNAPLPGCAGAHWPVRDGRSRAGAGLPERVYAASTRQAVDSVAETIRRCSFLARRSVVLARR